MKEAIVTGTNRMIKVDRSDGKGQSFLLDPEATLEDVRGTLTSESFMRTDDLFLNDPTSAVARNQEPRIRLADVVQGGVLNIGQPTPVSPIGGGDGIARYNQLTDDQRRAIFENVEIFRGLTFTKQGFDKTFQDVYAWRDGTLPTANQPRIVAELTSTYSFSKVTHDLNSFGAISGSVSLSAPFASAEAEFSYQQKQQQSSSQVTEYLLNRYIVRKVRLQAAPSSIVPISGFVQAIRDAIKGQEDSIYGALAVLRALDKWGYYIPVEFSLGGVIFAEDTTTISELSSAESKRQEFSGSFSASFDGIGGGAALKNASGSDSGTSSSSKFQNIAIQTIGGTPGLQGDFKAWAGSLDQAINWSLADVSDLYPTLALLNSDNGDRQALGTAITLLDRYRSYSAVQTAQPYVDTGAYSGVLQQLVSPF